MKILVATDGSAAAARAVEEVARRPWPAGTTVRLLAAIKPYAPPVTEFVLAGATMDDVRQGQRDNAERATARAAEQIAAQGWRVDTVVVEGDPRTAIVEAADDWNADLIVMGSHGHSALQRLLMGSVAQAVVAHAHCSVEVVRRRDA